MMASELIKIVYTSDGDIWHGDSVIVSQDLIEKVVENLDENYRDRKVHPGTFMTDIVYLLEGGNVHTLRPIGHSEPAKRKNSVYLYSLTMSGINQMARELGLPTAKKECRA